MPSIYSATGSVSFDGSGKLAQIVAKGNNLSKKFKVSDNTVTTIPGTFIYTQASALSGQKSYVVRSAGNTIIVNIGPSDDDESSVNYAAGSTGIQQPESGTGTWSDA